MCPPHKGGVLTPLLQSHGQLEGGNLASVVQGPLAALEAMPTNMWWHGGVSEPQWERLPDGIALIAMCFEPCNRIFKGIQEKQKEK